MSSFRHLQVNNSLKSSLVSAANHALTTNTHSSYRTAIKMWNYCAAETNNSGQLPAKDDEILVFTAWLISRGVRGSTISCYLSGLRTAHLTEGLNPPTIRSELVKTIITGKSNLDNIEKRTGLTRVRAPVTPAILHLLRAELKKSLLCKHDELLIWSVSTLMYFGGFRCHELLCKTSNTFDPAFTLLTDDVKQSPIMIKDKLVHTVQIRLKSEKKDKKGDSTIIDIYASGNQLCPVSAYKDYTATSDREARKPVFRLANGRPLTGRVFNSYIKRFLGVHLNTDTRYISSHSFRAGLASMIGSLGYSDQQLKDVGRWSSTAYTTYLKLPRTRRIEMAKELSQLDL